MLLVIRPARVREIALIPAIQLRESLFVLSILFAMSRHGLRFSPFFSLLLASVGSSGLYTVYTHSYAFVRCLIPMRDSFAAMEYKGN